MTDKEVEIINNYSPKAEVIIVESIHGDEVEVNIPR
jgi:succinylglutamate desuccinylase